MKCWLMNLIKSHTIFWVLIKRFFKYSNINVFPNQYFKFIHILFTRCMITLNYSPHSSFKKNIYSTWKSLLVSVSDHKNAPLTSLKQFYNWMNTRFVFLGGILSSYFVGKPRRTTLSRQLNTNRSQFCNSDGWVKNWESYSLYASSCRCVVSLAHDLS